jgi:hypothetical protein
MAKHSLEELRKSGRSLYQPYAAEESHNRDVRARRDAARQEADAAASRYSRAEGVFGLMAAKVRDGSRADFTKQYAELEKATKDKAETARFVEWLDAQVRESDARLAELEAAATEYVCREVSRPESEAAAAMIDDALEALVAGLEREEEVRRDTARAIRKADAEGGFRLASQERMGRYLRALTLSVVGDLSDVRHAVECWRKEAARGGYTHVRKPRGRV